MERGATSAALMLLVTVIFIFLTMDVVMSENSCVGGQISDAGTHSAYVAHVLSELATVTPTKTPKLEDIAAFPPGNGANCTVVGAASCADPNDADLCASCLSKLQQWLLGSCTTWSGGYAEEQSVCTMVFRTG